MGEGSSRDTNFAIWNKLRALLRKSAEGPIGTSLALQCSAGLVGRGFPCKVA